MDEPPNANPQWIAPDLFELFPVEDESRELLSECLSVRTLTFNANSKLARRFFLDPLPYLAENLGDVGVTEEWTASLERVNAHVAAGVKSGPRKLLCVLLLLLRSRHAHVVVYRLPDDG
jgi:hypothetical protein